MQYRCLNNNKYTRISVRQAVDNTGVVQFGTGATVVVNTSSFIDYRSQDITDHTSSNYSHWTLPPSAVLMLIPWGRGVLLRTFKSLYPLRLLRNIP